MAASRLPALRYAPNHLSYPFLRGSQKRWAQVHDVRFLVTHHRSERLLEKYKDKLDRKVKREGLRNIDELKAVYQEKIQEQRRKLSSIKAEASSVPPSAFPPPPPPQSTPDTTTATDAPSSQAAPSPKHAPPSGVKTLASYIDIPKTLELPSKEIEYIWRLRHASDPQSLCAVIPQDSYNRIEATARRHPQFILPLPRKDQGAEIHFLQWAFPTPTTTTVLLTHLAEFKLRGEYAQPHTTFTHHLDIADQKGLVLLNGSVVDGRGITVEEARWLIMCMQKFYGAEGNVERKKLLEKFSQGDDGFKVEDLLEEAEKIA